MQNSEIDEIDGVALPFDADKQGAVLGWLMVDDNFFLQAKGKIKPEWFVDAYNNQLWKCILDFYAAYHRRPTAAELQSSFMFLQSDKATRAKLDHHLRSNTDAMKKYGLDVVRREMTLWLKSVIFKQQVEHATSIFNESGETKCPNPAAKLTQAFLILKRAASDIDQTEFDASQAVDFSDVGTGAFFEKKEQELRTGLVFGCDLVDHKLNPDCIAPGGALLRGDHTLLIAPTNVGKTTTMVSVIKENMRRFKDFRCLFLSHEGRVEDIKTKFLCSITGKTYKELSAYAKTPEGIERLGQAARVIGERLTWVPYMKAGGYVEDVDVIIRQQQERALLRGRGFDMIVCDYPAKLSTQRAERGWQPRHIMQYVYNYFTQIGLELNAHVLSAIQTNREGSKVNNTRKGSEERLLGLEDVSEAFEATHTPTNVITLNRDPIARMKNRITFHIVKSRSNDTGWSIVSQSRMSSAISHGQGLNATAYRGQSPMSEKIDDFLTSYAGQAIPEGLYL